MKRTIWLLTIILALTSACAPGAPTETPVVTKVDALPSDVPWTPWTPDVADDWYGACIGVGGTPAYCRCALGKTRQEFAFGEYLWHVREDTQRLADFNSSLPATCGVDAPSA